MTSSVARVFLTPRNPFYRFDRPREEEDHDLTFREDILLLEASHPHRSRVAGCETRETIRRKSTSGKYSSLGCQTVPSPRLVGIELNPGPTVEILPDSSIRKRRNRRRGKKSKTNRGQSLILRRPHSSSAPARNLSLTTLYCASLRDPFNVGPPSIGFGCLIPLTKSAFFCRQVIAGSTLTAYNQILTRPCVDNMVTVSSVAALSTPFSSGTVVSFDATNSTVIQNAFQSARVISGGCRIRVLGPMTAAPPILMGGAIYDTYNNIATLSPTNTVNQSQLNFTNSVTSAAQVVFRPGDNSDFVLLPNVVNTAGLNTVTPYNHAVFYLSFSGTPTGYTLLIESLYHMEGNSGVDASGIDVEPTVADELPSLESAVHRAVATQGPELTELGLASTARALQSVVQRHSRRSSRVASLSLNSEGGWTAIPPSFSSSSSLNPITSPPINARYGG